MANNRVTYAISQVALKDSSSAATNQVLPLSASGVNPSGFWEAPRGVQSIGITTAFNLEQVFELGKIAIYENVEGTPDVEVTINRVLDGTHPLYLIASDSTGSTLIGRNEDYRTDITMNIYNDNQSSTDEGEGSNAAFVSAVYASGMFLSSVTYTFPVDGSFTEEVAFVGNNKFWSDVTANGSAPSGEFPSGIITSDEDPTVNVGNLDGVQRRENFVIATSKFPTEMPGVDGNGLLGADGDCLQTITVTADLGREDVFCLGDKNPFFRFITLPIEVTTTIEVHSKQGDLIEADGSADNLTNQEIVLKTTGGLTLDLKSQNKLTSVDMGGNDAGGGNLTVTYTYQNFNDLVVTHADFN